MITLNATVGAETANSFGTLVEADDYFSNYPNSVKRDSWSASSDDEKKILMIQATVMLNALRMVDHDIVSIPTLGQRLALGAYATANTSLVVPSNMVQSLQLPRNIDIHTDGTYVIPTAAKWAQFEQAIYLKTFDDSVLAAQRQGIFRDGLTVEGVNLSQGYTGRGDAYSPMAIALIRPLLRQKR
jgi:hypothetical protein